MSRRSFLKKSAGTLLSITGIGMGGHYYAHDIEPGWIDIKRITIKHKLIPEGFNGFKIVQFSDTHLGFQFQIKDLTSVITKMEKLNPDVMIFSGDLMDHPNEYPMPEEIIPYLKKIKTPCGKYCIYGNHDHGGNGSERSEILSPWRKEYPHDANMFYATAISEAHYWSTPYMQILKFINIAKSNTPQNKRLASWYEKEAYKMLKIKEASDSGKF